MKIKLSQTKLALILSAFFIACYNFSFFGKMFAVYPLSAHNFLSLASVVVILFSVTNLVINLLLFPLNMLLRLARSKKLADKGFVAVVLLLSMTAAYVMDSYGVVIDDTMLLNALRTDANESLDLITFKLALYLVFLFILPVWFVYKAQIDESSFKEELISRLKTISISIVVIFAMLFSFGKFYASFFRQHKPLRYSTNPTYWIYSMGKLSSSMFKNSNRPLAPLGRDSALHPEDMNRDLVIMVVGETARRDRFSLNGNPRETNPLLKKENVISFTNATSCGTSTATSVPCMFSHLGRDKFSVEDASAVENLLDVLLHTKEVNILWRDNNSNSKGVAARTRFEDYKSAPTNTICDTECRDEGMLVGLQDYIDNVKEKDIFIVLHQMGNHGPAYYKRYPKKFEVFTPVCRTSELEKCTNEEIVNTYDNVILYTDYFLAKVIALLKANSAKFNTGMFYMSDHGESLGENGIYLHGMPYMMAPKEQKDVAMILWFGGGMEAETDYVSLRKRINEPYSHDNIFHTILGMIEVKSSAYDPKKDILHGVHFPKGLKKN